SYSPGTTSDDVSSNTEWTVSCNQPWLSVTPSGSGNGAIVVPYDENNEVGSVSDATITVSGLGVGDSTVTIAQSSPPPSLAVTPANRDVTSSSGTTVFSVTSKMEWTASSNQS